MPPWTLYILECRDGTLYTGITTDLDRRLLAHAEGKGAKYTKGRGPFTLVYTEPCENQSEAARRERAVKALSREAKRQLVQL